MHLKPEVQNSFLRIFKIYKELLRTLKMHYCVQDANLKYTNDNDELITIFNLLSKFLLYVITVNT